MLRIAHKANLTNLGTHMTFNPGTNFKRFKNTAKATDITAE